MEDFSATCGRLLIRLLVSVLSAPLSRILCKRFEKVGQEVWLIAI